MPKDSGIGAATRRREDARFLLGSGRYSDDIVLLNQTFAVFARSEVANGIIKNINTSEAEKMPGVITVFTGNDFVDVGGNPAGWLINSRDGEPMKEPKRPVLAHGKVRHVGDAYAAVIAETEQQARDAAEKINADIMELPAIIDMTSALSGSNYVHDEIETNQCFDWGWIEDNREATDNAIKNAHHVTTLELTNNRLVPNAMEPRCSIADYNAANDDYTLYTTSQNPHLTRLLISAFVLGIPENKLTVVSPDVGGGFGSKIYHYGEEALVLAAAKRIKRPVRWTASRSESFMTDAHGRDHVTKIELALDKDNNFLAFRTETMANVGAYLSNFSTVTPTILHGTLMAGNYSVPNIYVNVKAVFTNTAPVDAYRGAGRPEATYSLERVIDKAALELNLDPIALRRQNFIKPDQFPYVTAAGLNYDVGDYDAIMDRLEHHADIQGFAERKKISEKQGKLRGFGVNSYIEACGIAPSNLIGTLGARVGLYDAATIRVNATGNISVMVGAHSHGQGHETAFPQIVADMLGVDPNNVEIVHGDTSKIPFGMGTYGSRSLAVCGSAIVRGIEKIIAKGKKIAAHMMESTEDNVDFEDGVFSVRGTNKTVSFGDVALKAYIPHNFPIEDIEPGLEETAFYDPQNFTYPAGAYACEVEVDPNTGKVSIERFAAADDFGNIINPMIVEGQVHGGLAQGIGQALLEGCIYNDDGQLISGSYMDYTMPRAADLPSFVVDHTVQTPSTDNPLGVKGCGEAGTIAATPTVMNAVINALGGKEISLPATAEKVWKACKEMKKSNAKAA